MNDVPDMTTDSTGLADFRGILWNYPSKIVIDTTNIPSKIEITANISSKIEVKWDTEMSANPEFLKKLIGKPKKYRSIDDPWEES